MSNQQVKRIDLDELAKFTAENVENPSPTISKAQLFGLIVQLLIRLESLEGTLEDLAATQGDILRHMREYQ